jgi:hypothetical protein
MSFVLCPTSLQAQTIPPPYINYQAVLYDVNGANPNNPLINQSFTTFVNINDELGNLLYREEHYASTDANGLITVKMGDGLYTAGPITNFNQIDWGVGKYYLVVDFVINGTTSSTAPEQLVTVPYSFYAGNAGNGMTSVIDNGDGTLTFTFANGATYTTPTLAGIQGPAGPSGASGTAGTDGQSAYDLWLAQGNTGTVQDFLNSLIGPPGVVGNILSGNSTGDLMYWNGTNWSIIPPGNPGNVLMLNPSGIPVWTSVSSGLGTSPFVSTNNITFNLSNGTIVFSGGKVLSDGGSLITNKGVCWSSTVNPTINDPKTFDGAGIGDFSSTLTGLISGVTYYVRAYAQNAFGVSYGNQLSFTFIQLGDTYQGGTVYYFLNSNDPGYSPNLLHGLIAAPTTTSSSIGWGCNSFNVAGAEAFAVGSGNQNTIEASVCGATFAAGFCDNLVLNTYSDWYLPSIDELVIMGNNRSILPSWSGTGYYYSSTESPTLNAWTLNANVYTPAERAKSGLYKIRAIRSF